MFQEFPYQRILCTSPNPPVATIYLLRTFTAMTIIPITRTTIGITGLSIGSLVINIQIDIAIQTIPIVIRISFTVTPPVRKIGNQDLR